MQNPISSIRRSIGAGGGIGVTLETPVDFSWDDRVIPVTVTVTGHRSKAREIEEIRFSFRDDDHSGDQAQRGENVKHDWTSHEQVSLAPGAVQSLKIEMPLPYDPEVGAALESDLGEQSSVAERLMAGMMRGGLNPPDHFRHYRVTVSVRMTGVKMGAGASRQIRYGGAVPGWQSHIRIGR